MDTVIDAEAGSLSGSDSQVERFRRIIRALIDKYHSISRPAQGVALQSVFDAVHDHYLLVEVGWEHHRHIHQIVIHIDILEEKVWLQRNETDQPLADELAQAGIPRERIVLGFQRPDRRQFTEYATA
jgi:hypothetical protein